MKIYRETVSDNLWEILMKLLQFEELQSFRLVGGTALSLLFGHRVSVDIDLFTDAEYNSIDFKVLDRLFTSTFKYVECNMEGNESFGKSYFLGYKQEASIKADLFYTDSFQYPVIEHMGLRISNPKEIIAMKLDIIAQNGRKKDFWDIHELMGFYSIVDMLDFYHKRYPYGYTREEIISKLTDFHLADDDLTPICLRGKYWELIKIDIEEKVKSLNS